MTGNGRVLVVEDEPDTQSLIALVLEGLGLDVTATDSGVEALELAATLDPDLVTLDLNLPDLDGTEVCRRLRAERRAQVLMITARDGDIDDLVDERVGAHDYLSKPVSVKELRARATALQARLVVPSDAPARAGDAPLDLGSGLVVRAAEQQVVLGEQTVPLTPIEVEVLATLARRKGEPCSRQELAASVWAGEFVESDYLVDVAVGGIRTKLRRAGSRARWIDAVDGTSYVLRPAV